MIGWNVMFIIMMFVIIKKTKPPIFIFQFLGWLNTNINIKKWKLRIIVTYTLNLIQS